MCNKYGIPSFIALLSVLTYKLQSMVANII